ncbi:MAG: cache domain-containing protein, partial [Betaproteobacteria bacterium]
PTRMRTTPLRRRLFLLAVVGILPLAALSGAGLILLLDQQRSQSDRAALDIARALATAVDAELRRSVSVLEILATSPQLDADDMRQFEDTARRAIAASPQWRSILLTDPTGSVLLNAGERDDAHDRLAASTSLANVVRTRAAVVGGLWVSGQKAVVGGLRVSGQKAFGIDIHAPVVRDSALRYVLAGVVKPEAILEVVKRQKVPDNWVISGTTFAAAANAGSSNGRSRTCRAWSTTCSTYRGSRRARSSCSASRSNSGRSSNARSNSRSPCWKNGRARSPSNCRQSRCA